MVSGCLCTAAVEDSYSFWELIKASAVSMAELWLLLNISHATSPAPPSQCWSKSQFLFCPCGLPLLERALQGFAPACPAWRKCHWGLRAFTSGVSTPLSSALSSMIRSVLFRSRGEFYPSSFSSSRTSLRLYCLDMFVYTQVWKYTLFV